MKERPVNNLGELLRAKLANDVFKSDLKLAKEKMELEQMKIQAAMQNAAISGTGLYGTPLTQASMANAIGKMWDDGASFDPNNEPAYQMALSALCDLWAAKHGDKWVNATHDDQFWIDAVERLGSAGKLETKRGWMRLKD